MRWIPCLGLFILCSCGGRPSAPLVQSEDAMSLRQVWTMRIDVVHDALRLKDHLPGASHAIEVTITAPENRAGQRLTLPYDDWQVGSAPPQPGSTVTLAPRTWITGDGSSHGRPIEGFDGTRPLDR